MNNSRYRKPVRGTGVNQKSQFAKGSLFSAGMVVGGNATSETLDEMFPEEPEYLDASIEEADSDAFSIFDLFG